MAQCSICKCDATGKVYGFRVCDYHKTHGESDPPCPTCTPICSRCETKQAMAGSVYCDNCYAARQHDQRESDSQQAWHDNYARRAEQGDFLDHDYSMNF